jgi:predicted DNA-binding transcriptional regulator AlpA
MEANGHFPKRVQISPGRVAWRESEIDAFVASRWYPKPSPK